MLIENLNTSFGLWLVQHVYHKDVAVRADDDDEDNHYDDPGELHSGPQLFSDPFVLAMHGSALLLLLGHKPHPTQAAV